MESAANSEIASEDDESESEGTGSEIETPEAEAAAPITSGRASTPTSRARASQCGVSIDPEGLTPGENLADTSAAASTSHGPDKRLYRSWRRRGKATSGVHSWTAPF